MRCKYLTCATGLLLSSIGCLASESLSVPDAKKLKPEFMVAWYKNDTKKKQELLKKCPELRMTMDLEPFFNNSLVRYSPLSYYTRRLVHSVRAQVNQVQAPFLMKVLNKELENIADPIERLIALGEDLDEKIEKGAFNFVNKKSYSCRKCIAGLMRDDFYGGHDKAKAQRSEELLKKFSLLYQQVNKESAKKLKRLCAKKIVNEKIDYSTIPKVIIEDPALKAIFIGPSIKEIVAYE